jgi:hypothetical protein
MVLIMALLSYVGWLLSITQKEDEMKLVNVILCVMLLLSLHSCGKVGPLTHPESVPHGTD